MPSSHVIGDKLQSAIDALGERGIKVDTATLKKFPVQGYMSEVFSAASDRGKIIIHVANLTPTLEHFRVWEKFIPISQLVHAVRGIPAAEVLLARKFPDYYFVVQKMLPGKGWGTSKIIDGVLTDSFVSPFESYASQVEAITAHIHSIQISGFGFLRPQSDTVVGTYPTWEAFLTSEVPLWIAGIASAEHARGSSSDGFVEKIRQSTAIALSSIKYNGPPVLVHGDITNPSNILIEDGAISGIVDWEWAVAGDPAWEFARRNPYRLTEYFRHFPNLISEEAREDFRRRAKMYEQFIFIMWMYARVTEPNGMMYSFLRSYISSPVTRYRYG